MIEEFKKFALRGNAVDLAIGVVIGAAFGAIVNSLVGDIMSPIIGGRYRRLRFLQLLSATVLKGDCDFAGRSQEARRRAGVGKLPDRRHQFHHHRLGFVPRGQADEPDDAVGGAEDACDDQAGDAAHGNPRLVEARAKVMRRAKFSSSGAARFHAGNLMRSEALFRPDEFSGAY